MKILTLKTKQNMHTTKKPQVTMIQLRNRLQEKLFFFNFFTRLSEQNTFAEVKYCVQNNNLRTLF